MATKKRASAKPAEEEPTKLFEFGPIIFYGSESMEPHQNLTRALIHIHEEIKDVKPKTKFLIGTSRVYYERSDKFHDNPLVNNEGIKRVTYRFLLNLWKEAEGRDFKYEDEAEDFRLNEEARVRRPGQMKGWSNSGMA